MSLISALHTPHPLAMGKPTVFQQWSAFILSRRPWQIKLSSDSPSYTLPAHTLINTELTLDPCPRTARRQYLGHPHQPAGNTRPRKSGGAHEKPQNDHGGTEVAVRSLAESGGGGYQGGRERWEDGSLRGQFEEPVAWLAVLILRSDARTEGVEKVVQWIEGNGAYGTLGEEEVEEERKDVESEYGWIDEDVEEKTEEIEDLTNLLVPETGFSGNCRFGMMVPHGQDLQE
ncbi:hypothetical protein BU25DRAFT_425119 [Macroventuria anomochaeta]|uniref:Uncharacterized protein n=1 Tax=Macroventuria anomochaeta TaxID=301207 RepID=A0ACB6RM59_9PLEO|nr:uncharacterized protein BU25DRAFT_425119 [Macroventuria anomochaeta]KAF2623106.1 hypothetical protein BU25DRAFT_425119 [Macroventuria anomochaeta]